MFYPEIPEIILEKAKTLSSKLDGNTESIALSLWQEISSKKRESSVISKIISGVIDDENLLVRPKTRVNGHWEFESFFNQKEKDELPEGELLECWYHIKTHSIIFAIKSEIYGDLFFIASLLYSEKDFSSVYLFKDEHREYDYWDPVIYDSLVNPTSVFWRKYTQFQKITSKDNIGVFKPWTKIYNERDEKDIFSIAFIAGVDTRSFDKDVLFECPFMHREDCEIKTKNKRRREFGEDLKQSLRHLRHYKSFIEILSVSKYGIKQEIFRQEGDLLFLVAERVTKTAVSIPSYDTEAKKCFDNRWLKKQRKKNIPAASEAWTIYKGATIPAWLKK